MSKFLNGLFDFVLHLLFRIVRRLPVLEETSYEIMQGSHIGWLWLVGNTECFVMERTWMDFELRHTWPGGDVVWVKLFGLDSAEGWRCVNVLGKRLVQWMAPEPPAIQPATPAYDIRDKWAIEYRHPEEPGLSVYASAGNAQGLGYVLRQIEREGGSLIRIMRMTAYLREIEAYYAFQAENNRYWACAEYFPGTGNVSRTWVVRSLTRPDDPNEDGDLVYPFGMGGRVTAGPFETQAEAELAACDHFMEND